MTFLPIVERELRVAARRPGVYRTRWFAALGMILAWLLLLVSDQRTAAAEVSQNLFISLGVLALGFALVAGIFLTADCLSEERREGTLGLLFLTDLQGYDVVLGKLIATSVHSVYGLLAIFPVLALPLMMGGVTGAEFWRVVAVLAVTLFLSLVMGIFVSAVAREARHAMAGTFLGMLLLAGFIPAVWCLVGFLQDEKPSTVLLWPSPAVTFITALDTTYHSTDGTRDYWGSLQLVFGLGLAFLIAAALLLPRTWQEKTNRETATRAPRWPARARNAAAGFRRARRLLAINPYLWLASRGGARDLIAGLVFALLGLLWLGCLVLIFTETARHTGEEVFGVCFITAYVLHQAGKYSMAVEATRRFGEDRRSGALELLLVTPLTETEIIRGQELALQRRARGLGLLLLAVNLVMCAVVLGKRTELELNPKDQALFLELFIGGMLSLWFDFRALQSVGMWAALRTAKHQWAVVSTLGRVMLLPWVGIFLGVFLLESNSINLQPEEFGVAFILWFGLGLLVDMVVAAQARARLGLGLRYWLSERSAVARDREFSWQPAAEGVG
jgi:ABC-type transport system involved in multi-copper enzyme maturation permease subunit